MQELSGKTAVVTGGASGMGNAMARRFAREGMKIVLVDVEADALASAATALEADGAEVLAQQVDVSDAAAMDALAEATLERFGAVEYSGNLYSLEKVDPFWAAVVEAAGDDDPVEVP